MDERVWKSGICVERQVSIVDLLEDSIHNFPSPYGNNTMSNDLRNLREFEEGAWRQLNGRPESEQFPADLHNRITAAWARLSHRNRHLVAAAADEFLTQQHDYNTAKAYVVTANSYQGSVNDDDAYGREIRRPSFTEYVRCKFNLLEVVRSLNDATQKLRQHRRLLGLPDNDYGAALLDMLSQHFEETLPTYEDEINNLHIEEQATAERLSERKRIAEGGLGRSWVGKWVLGEGSFGKATLFVKQNAARQVADHIVIKESNHKDMSHIWYLKELWTGWKGPDDPSSIPHEIQAMYNLGGKNGSEHIIKIRNWRIRRDDLYHRIYMEFCPRGDLYTFCCGEKDDDPYWNGAERRELFPNDDLRGMVDLVPEPFLWSVFRSLASAAVLMKRGTMAANEADRDWEVIVHRDLKLGNVFASWPSDRRFRGYPEMKVADFGLTLLMPPNNDKVAEDYSRHGTPGSRAPEHASLVSAGDGTYKMMSSKTNVWNVGIVLYSLITCSEGLSAPYITWDGEGCKKMPELDLTARLHYSEELLSLIFRCLRYNDEERPTVDELMDEITALTGDGEFDLASGLADAPIDDPGWQEHKIHLEQSKWKIGMAMRNAPHPEGGGPWPPPAPPKTQFPSADDFGGGTGKEIVKPK